jgi:hypothetical protein
VVNRPSDWHVIGLDADPTPGDPFRVRELSRKLRELAADAEFAAGEVRRLSSADGALSWVGEAGAVFAAEVGELPGQLDKLDASYEIAGRALKTYGDGLEAAQVQADGALSRGREAHVRLVAAREQLGPARTADATARLGLETLTTVPASWPGAPPPPPDLAEVTRATRAQASASAHLTYVQGLVAAAQDDVDAEQRLALAAKELREDAARTCTREINRASDAGIQNDSWWTKVGDFLADAWNVAVDISKAVVLVLGLVVLIIGGPLAWVVLAAGIILLIDALIKYSRGEGSLWDVGWALLGCIPGTRGLTTLGGLAKGLRALRASPAAFARGFLTSGRALLGRMAANVRGGWAYVTTFGRSLLPHGAAVTPDGQLVMMMGDSVGDAHHAAREAFDAARSAGDGASSGPLPGAADEAERIRALGEDPATGAFRQSEMETANRVEQELGVTLERSTDPQVDWVDPASGKTYDAVGNFDSKYFDQQWPNLQVRIMDHLAKADFVPIDVTKFTPAQVAQVEQFIQNLGPRVFIVGR